MEQSEKQLWINGEWVHADLDFLYQFIHDLPPPANDDLITEWLKLFSYGEAGGSEWSHELLRKLAHIKLCILQGAEVIVREYLATGQCSPSSALKPIERAIAEIDVMSRSAQRELVTCWAEEPSVMEALYRKIMPSMAEIFNLPHLWHEKFSAESDARRLSKACKNAEMEFNRWKKRMLRGQH